MGEKIKDKYECIVIGGGLGGVTIASLLALYGINVLLIEKNNYLGGYITDYKVKDYVFSHSIDWFSGLHDKGKARIWLEKIGVIDQIPFKQLEIFKRVITDNYNIALYSDWDNFSEELIANFPHEEKNVVRFIELVRSFGGPKWIDYFRPFKKETYEKMLDTFFTDKALKEILSANINSDMSAYLYILFLYRCLSKEIYLPSKHTLNEMFKIIENSIIESGVSIIKEKSVEKIYVQDNCVTGVELDDGRFISADGIISDIDLKYLYNKMLPAGSVNNYFMNKLNKRFTSESLIATFIGVDKCFDNISLYGEPIVYLPKHDDNKYPEDLSDLEIKINIKSIYQPFLCKQGKSAIDIRAFTPKGYFQEKRVDKSYRNSKRYLYDKQYLTDRLIKTSQRVLGDYNKQIQHVRTATPYTFHRYTNGEGGSPMGWVIDPLDYVNGFRILSPISNLFHVGSWASFPGIEGVINYCFSLLPRIVRYYGRV